MPTLVGLLIGVLDGGEIAPRLEHQTKLDRGITLILLAGGFGEERHAKAHQYARGNWSGRPLRWTRGERSGQPDIGGRLLAARSRWVMIAVRGCRNSREVGSRAVGFAPGGMASARTPGQARQQRESQPDERHKPAGR